VPVHHPIPLPDVDRGDPELVCGCTATFTQMAGIAALEGPQGDVDMMVAAGCEFSRLHMGYAVLRAQVW